MIDMKAKKRLRRSMLFLNCQKPALIRDPYVYRPDSIMLDLEDAVAENQRMPPAFPSTMRCGRWITAVWSGSSASTDWTPHTGRRTCASAWQAALT